MAVLDIGSPIQDKHDQELVSQGNRYVVRECPVRTHWSGVLRGTKGILQGMLLNDSKLAFKCAGIAVTSCFVETISSVPDLRIALKYRLNKVD
jgi:hypothetical protein